MRWTAATAVPVRSNRGLIRAPAKVDVVVHADDDIDLELWGLRRKRELFERVFRCRLEVVEAQLVLPLYGDGAACVARAWGAAKS